MESNLSVGQESSNSETSKNGSTNLSDFEFEKLDSTPENVKTIPDNSEDKPDNSEDTPDNAGLRERLIESKPQPSKIVKLHSRPSFKKDKIDAHYDRLHWVAAAFGRLFGLKFAPINIPLERRLQTFAAFFWMSTFLFMGLGTIIIFTYLFFYTQLWWIPFGYAMFFIGDSKIHERGGRRWQWVRNWRMWKNFANFFPAKIIKTCDYDPSKNYIFGYHPHGILSAGATAHFATEGTSFSKLFPGLIPHLLVLGGHFSMPLYRDFFMCFGAVSASKESINYLLGGEKKGKAVALVIGGAAESLDCHPDMVVLHLSKRKGFCKLALKNGACLVPTFSFGENSIYEQYPNPSGSALRNLQEALRKVIGLAPCIFVGRGVFQYSFGIVPFRKPINTVFGSPIEVPQVKDPSTEQINALHKTYVEAVVKIYNDYKDQFAEDPTIPITIV